MFPSNTLAGTEVAHPVDRFARGVATFVRTAWAASGSVLLTAGSILLASDSEAQGTQFRIGIAVSVLGVVLALYHAPRVGRALERERRANRRARDRAASLKEIMRGVMMALLEDLGIDPLTGRATIYRHTDGKFIPLARVSDSVQLTKLGKVNYSDKKGVIGRAWDKQKAVAVDLPADRDAWIATVVKDWGFTREEASAIGMQSRSLVGKRIDVSGTTPGPIGVLVIESLAPRGVNSRTLDRISEAATWPLTMKILIEVAQCLDAEDVIPEPKQIRWIHKLWGALRKRLGIGR